MMITLSQMFKKNIVFAINKFYLIAFISVFHPSVLMSQGVEDIYNRIKTLAFQKELYNRCNHKQRDWNLSKDEFNECLKSELDSYLIANKKYNELIKSFNNNKSVMQPIGYDISNAKNINENPYYNLDLISSSKVLLKEYHDIPKGTIYYYDGFINYKTDKYYKYYKEQFKENYSEMDKDRRVFIMEEDDLGYDKLLDGGGDYLLNKEQIKFLEKYCFGNDENRSSMCNGRSFFIVHTTTFYEENKEKIKSQAWYGLQYIGSILSPATPQKPYLRFN